MFSRKFQISISALLIFGSSGAFADFDLRFNRQIHCLQENIYHESRGEPLSARKAVAEVTLRRSNTKGYPKDVCSVVSQYKQFSWVKKKHPVHDKHAWKLARIAAVEVYRGFTKPVTQKAIYFNHVSYGKRYPTQTKPIIIGRLEFY